MKIKTIILLTIFLISITAVSALTIDVEGNVSMGNNYLLWDSLTLYPFGANTLKTNNEFNVSETLFSKNVYVSGTDGVLDILSQTITILQGL